MRIPTLLLAFAILLGPGVVTYTVVIGIMAWRLAEPLFPVISREAMPMVIATLTTGAWWLALAAVLFVSVAWDEGKKQKHDLMGRAGRNVEA